MPRYRTIADVTLFALKACIATLWTVTACAAAVLAASADAFGAELLMLHPLLVVLACFISSLSGATAIAWRANTLMLKEDARLRREGGERRPFVRPWLFVVAHMGGSWLAGALAFFLSRKGGLDVWGLMAFVLVASFLGAKFVEVIAERWLGTVRMPALTVGGGAT